MSDLGRLRVVVVCRCGWQGDSEAAWTRHRAVEIDRALEALGSMPLDAAARPTRWVAIARADLEHGSHVAMAQNATTAQVAVAHSRRK